MVTGFLIIAVGILFVIFKRRLGTSAAALYAKLGIVVPGESYARQFVFIGILMMITGFLVVTGLWQDI